ncbi:Z-ring formation inhibitor MciZ [Gordoniibacillus kamchatkensis]|uniref:Z-ring formation inhibitor MciZ n=1 Tax=Gordoniibacillus kamchatkensis TaxID=1590651 RepID=UPI0012E055F9|nr:Z-ring formation inhibitor MciZ [Paenibacillus sp. VKM B-2647]
MKSYRTERQWRLVGKAWEIRAHLRKQLQQADRDVTLHAWLGRRSAASAGRA